MLGSPRAKVPRAGVNSMLVAAVLSPKNATVTPMISTAAAA